MYQPTNSADYPSAQQSIDCTELVEILQENPKAIIIALDKAMSRILPDVLASKVELNQSDVDQFNHLKSLRDGLIKSVFNFNIG